MSLHDGPGFADLGEPLPKVNSLAPLPPENWFSLSSIPWFPLS